eukprot:GILJ01003862.1.p1 GENE.GILJ01003862.1~~GILJ01003862.1.p1  ORF type:complete len:536 (-),score=61.21 GILJ01003862.1:254-1795(-)
MDNRPQITIMTDPDTAKTKELELTSVDSGISPASQTPRAENGSPSSSPRRLSPRSKRTQRRKSVDPQHEQYELTHDMMLGIRTAVSKVTPLHDRELDIADFNAMERYKFPHQGSRTTPAHHFRDFKFKDYAPLVFRQMRERFNINAADYLLSLCGDFNYIEFVSNSKSGQFFFYSNDGKFLIKTQTKAESRFLRRILPDLYTHVMKNPNTLMTKFFGMHRVKPHKGHAMHFLIMGSVFDSDKEIHERYDLKGSTIGRAASEAEKAGICPVLKDLDFVNAGVKIRIGEAKKKQLLDQLEADCLFLERANIMDYSLLLGVHYRNRETEDGLGAVLYKLRRKTTTMLSRSSNERSERGSLENGVEGDAAGGRGESSVSGTSDRSLHVTSSGPGFHMEGSPLTAVGTHPVPLTPSGGVEVNYDELRKALGTPRSERIEVVSSMFAAEDGGIHGVDEDGHFSNEIYYMGIIDILQVYNLRKRFEHLGKSLKYDANEISAVKPSSYASRLIRFIREHSL